MLRESHTSPASRHKLPALLTLICLSLTQVASAPAAGFNFGRKAKPATVVPAGQGQVQGQVQSQSQLQPANDLPVEQRDMSSEDRPMGASPERSMGPDPNRAMGADPDRSMGPDPSKSMGADTENGFSSNNRDLTRSWDDDSRGAGAAQKPPAAAQPKAAFSGKAFHRKDLSQAFSYVLPDGWGTYQIPFQIHDCLSLRENGRITATISFADEEGRADLTKLKEEAVDSDKKELEKYELEDSKIETLPNGQRCARIASHASINEVETRQLKFIIELKKKHFITATLTVGKPIGQKYDKLMQDVVASITTDPNPDRKTK